MRFIYLEMPNFTKTINELESDYDKWLYILKNISNFEDAPEILNQGIFMEVFEIAEIANYSSEEMLAYEDSLKSYRDLKNSMITYREEGFQKGEVIGFQKGEIVGLEKGVKRANKINAINCIHLGLDNQTIHQITNLSIFEIDQIRKELSK